MNNPVHNSVVVSVPNRFHMFTTRSHFNVNGETGGAGISISTSNTMRITVSAYEKSKPLVLDSFCKIMKKELRYDGYFDVMYNEKETFPVHSGFGTNISKITALCFGINYMFGKVLSNGYLRNLIMDNYCEQEGNVLVRGLDTGCGTACSLYGGLNLTINNNSFVHLEPQNELAVLSFIPSNEKFNKIINFSEENTDSTQSSLNDDISLNERMDLIYKSFIPAILMEDWATIGEDVAMIHTMGVKKMECVRYDYEFERNLIKDLRKKGALVVGLSSLGPVNYCIVTDKNKMNIKDYLYTSSITQHIWEHRINKNGIDVVVDL